MYDRYLQHETRWINNWRNDNLLFFCCCVLCFVCFSFSIIFMSSYLIDFYFCYKTHSVWYLLLNKARGADDLFGWRYGWIGATTNSSSMKFFLYVPRYFTYFYWGRGSRSRGTPHHQAKKIEKFEVPKLSLKDFYNSLQFVLLFAGSCIYLFFFGKAFNILLLFFQQFVAVRNSVIRQ